MKVLYICVQIAIVIMAMGATQRYDSGVVLVTAMVMSLLWRIVCEETVLFFSMQDTLTSITGRLDTLIRVCHIALDHLDRAAVKTEEPKQQTRESGSDGADGAREEREERQE